MAMGWSGSKGGVSNMAMGFSGSKGGVKNREKVEVCREVSIFIKIINSNKKLK